MIGCVWYNIDGEDAFYTSSADQNLPDQSRPYGPIDIGFMVDVVGVTKATPSEQWAKFIRRSDSGEAILWMKRQTNQYGRKPGIPHPHCVEIVNLPLPEERPVSPFSGRPAIGQVMCTIASPLYKKDQEGNLVPIENRTVQPGELFWYDSEDKGIIRSWYEVGGVDAKCYFKRVRVLEEGLGGWLDKIMLVGQFSGAWDQVPVLGKPDEPPPPPPPAGTGCLAWGIALLQKFLDWLKKL